MENVPSRGINEIFIRRIRIHGRDEITPSSGQNSSSGFLIKILDHSKRVAR